jgi:hypothetical protein
MKYKTFFYLVLAVFVGVSALSIILPRLAQAQKPALPLLAQTGQGDINDAAVTGELWKLGFTVETGPLTYNSLIGRVASEAAAFRSNRNTGDIYYIFPAPATQKTIQSAKFYILDRTGAYAAGNATLTLQIFNFAGAVQRTASAASVDLQTTATGTWTPMTLSSTAADLQISPGEFLAFHFNLSGASAGNLDVRPIFEVEVQ